MIPRNAEDRMKSSDAGADLDTAAGLLAQIEAEQDRLRDLLAARDPSLLARRPANGNWSVVENLRHLLFAEQLHLGRLLPEPPPFSPFGLTPDGLRDKPQLRPAGTRPSTDASEVLQAWAAAHAAIRRHLAADTPELRRALHRHLRHLRTHLRLIERLLRGPAARARVVE
jgi:hypothetical protein